jgi:hypothetical protein
LSAVWIRIGSLRALRAQWYAEGTMVATRARPMPGVSPGDTAGVLGVVPGETAVDAEAGADAGPVATAGALCGSTDAAVDAAVGGIAARDRKTIRLAQLATCLTMFWMCIGLMGVGLINVDSAVPSGATTWTSNGLSPFLPAAVMAYAVVLRPVRGSSTRKSDRDGVTGPDGRVN